MTRKRRKTRSRQQRRRIHERTRQTFAQAYFRDCEARWKDMFDSAKTHPFVTLMAQRGDGPLATHSRWVIP